MSKRIKNKRVKQMMDDVAFSNWETCRETLTNELINALKLYKHGYFYLDAETRFVSLTASELKGE